MERGMNERIRKLRRQSMETEPHIYMERANLETDAYLMYEGSVSVPEMRALAFKHFMANKTQLLPCSRCHEYCCCVHRRADRKSVV